MPVEMNGQEIGTKTFVGEIRGTRGVNTEKEETRLDAEAEALTTAIVTEIETATVIETDIGGNQARPLNIISLSERELLHSVNLSVLWLRCVTGDTNTQRMR